MPRAFLGIDIGTSAAKVLALSERGATIAKARRGYATRTPAPNWAEQSPEEWWQATIAAVSDVVRDIGATEIGGIGLSGQLNCFALTDADGALLQDAIIWLDLRAVAEARDLAIGLGSEIAAVTGNRISPISVMAKLRWMKRHHPEVLGRTKRPFLVKDYLLWRLTGVHATDPSDASASNLMEL